MYLKAQNSLVKSIDRRETTSSNENLDLKPASVYDERRRRGPRSGSAYWSGSCKPEMGGSENAMAGTNVETTNVRWMLNNILNVPLTNVE